LMSMSLSKKGKEKKKEMRHGGGREREEKKETTKVVAVVQPTSEEKTTTHLSPSEPRPDLFSRVGGGVGHGAFDAGAPVLSLLFES